MHINGNQRHFTFQEMLTKIRQDQIFIFQGSIIDRIDHNIENTQIKVEEGLKQLKKAERYQKKDRKMHCIVILAVIVMILLFVLIITKT